MSAATHDDVAIGGWAGRVMVFLRVGAQLVAVNLLVVLGTLAGGVRARRSTPRSAPAAPCSRASRRAPPSEHLLREFWAAYRAGFRRLNLLGAPLTVGRRAPRARRVGARRRVRRSGEGRARRSASWC